MRSEGRIERAEEKHASWWVEAISAAAGGALISAVVSIVIAVGIASDFAPAKAIERFGIDTGMKFLWSFAPQFDGGLAEPPRFAFIDVDTKACLAFRAPPEAATCRTDKPVPPGLVIAVADMARRSGAAVLVVDVAPYAAPEERAALHAALVHSDGPWIIAPLAGRPGGVRDGRYTFEGDARLDAPFKKAEGRFRFASFGSLNDPEADDGLVRSYAVTTLTSDLSSGTRAPIPSAPILAAALTEGELGPALDCSYYGMRCNSLRKPEPPFGGRQNERIFFSLPSLALGHSRAELARLSNRYQPSYVRLELGRLLRAPGKPLPADRADLEGRIVVLGSSLPGAMDISMTPIGPMAGAEILINATRTFAARMRAGARQVEPAQDLRRKLEAGFVGAVLLLPAWLLIFLLQSRTQKRSWWVRGLVAVASVFIFFGFISAIALWELWENAHRLTGAMASGEQVDLVTPVVSLGLEAYAEAVMYPIRIFEVAFAAAFLSLLGLGWKWGERLKTVIRRR